MIKRLFMYTFFLFCFALNADAIVVYDYEPTTIVLKHNDKEMRRWTNKRKVDIDTSHYKPGLYQIWRDANDAPTLHSFLIIDPLYPDGNLVEVQPGGNLLMRVGNGPFFNPQIYSAHRPENRIFQLYQNCIIKFVRGYGLPEGANELPAYEITISGYPEEPAPIEVINNENVMFYGNRELNNSLTRLYELSPNAPTNQEKELALNQIKEYCRTAPRASFIRTRAPGNPAERIPPTYMHLSCELDNALSALEQRAENRIVVDNRNVMAMLNAQALPNVLQAPMFMHNMTTFITYPDPSGRNIRYGYRPFVNNDPYPIGLIHYGVMDVLTKVWSLINAYVPPAEDALPAERHRANMKAALITQLGYVIEDDGHLVCETGKIKRILLPLQGYFPGIQLDPIELDVSLMAREFRNSIVNELRFAEDPYRRRLNDVINMYDYDNITSPKITFDFLEFFDRFIHQKTQELHQLAVENNLTENQKWELLRHFNRFAGDWRARINSEALPEIMEPFMGKVPAKNIARLEEQNVRIPVWSLEESTYQWSSKLFLQNAENGLTHLGPRIDVRVPAIEDEELLQTRLAVIELPLTATNCVKQFVQPFLYPGKYIDVLKYFISIEEAPQQPCFNPCKHIFRNITAYNPEVFDQRRASFWVSTLNGQRLRFPNTNFMPEGQYYSDDLSVMPNFDDDGNYFTCTRPTIGHENYKPGRSQILFSYVYFLDPTMKGFYLPESEFASCTMHWLLAHDDAEEMRRLLNESATLKEFVDQLRQSPIFNEREEFFAFLHLLQN
jgi:hypothetical protein